MRRRCRATVVSLLLLAAALLVAPAASAGPGQLRPVPDALERAIPRIAGAASLAAPGSPRSHGAVDLIPGTIAGYIPLDLFGGTTVIPIGDEDLRPVDVPPYAYNGETFSTISVDSNGYAIPGRTTAREDNNCCDISLGPERPNGILAPFWTDLDGTGATGILHNVLTDGVGTWAVIEWRVNDFGTLRQRTFQLWIGVNGVQDIAYSYNFATFGEPPSGMRFVVAAENIEGTLFDSLGFDVMPTTDQYLLSGPPVLNEVPVANTDTYNTAEDTPRTVAAPGVLGNDTDGENDTLTAALVTGPGHGTGTLNADGSFTYTPAPDYSGPDSFTYIAKDPYDPSEPATVNLDVTPVADAPIVIVEAALACGTDDRSGSFRLRLADVDTAASALTLSAQSSNAALLPASGVSFSGTGAQRTALLRAVAGRAGSATATVTVSDGTTTGTATIEVRSGGNGADALTGTGRPDLLLGQNGSDTLSGLGGVDALCGGRGDDAMTGGTGADHFGGGQGTDQATDFSAADGDTQDSTP